MSLNSGSSAVQTINPYEFALDVGYSRKLSEKFSVGVVLRYILSDLSYEDTSSGETNSPANAFSVDLSGYYVTYPMVGRNECQFSFGFNISNVGTKVSYDHVARIMRICRPICVSDATSYFRWPTIITWESVLT